MQINHDRFTKALERDPSLPDCIICDIDGTLAIMGNRSPYDWGKVGLDKVNEPVRELLYMIKNFGVEQHDYKIILLSGRDGSCEELTREWLKVNGVPYDHLFMREAGDMRKDNTIKKEIYNAYIKGQYNVEFVLDDRDQVVDLWRNELGLPCFQVNYGDF